MILMFLFSLMGSIIGSAEDLLPYIPICVGLSLALGFDSITGTAIVLCGGAAGFAGAFMNAYTEGVAQGIAGLFFGLSVVSAIIGGMSVNQFAESISKGMEGICAGALVCGFARGIMVVLTDGNVIHTILHATADVLMKLPSVISAIGMYIFQCLLNFIIPSGSGQASVSMPIMAPLADMVGVTRQTATLAFQLGDGISNIFTPTSGYFMAALALAKIPWEKWVRWILPLIGLQYLLGAILVVVAHMMNWGPF